VAIARAIAGRPRLLLASDHPAILEAANRTIVLDRIG
jgi:ABC-type lipoprotein export system ATPase subunit